MKRIVVLLCVLVAVGCAGKKQESEQQIYKGIFDELSYTSPNGWFTVYVNEIVDKKTIKEVVKLQSSQVQLIFLDQAGNKYSLKASYAPGDISGTFVDDMVEQARKKGADALKTKTPDDKYDCFVSTLLAKNEEADKGYGKLNMVFYKDKIIFDLVVVTKAYKDPKDAANALDGLIRGFWRLSRLRGMPRDLPVLIRTKDPRIPVAIMAAGRAAAKYGLKMKVEEKAKPIFRVAAEGEKGEIIISIGFATATNALVLTNYLTSEKGDEEVSEVVKENFFTAFEQALVDEKLAIKNSDEADQDLM